MSHAAKLAAYSSAQAHGGVAAADPHRLIVMLMDGALERLQHRARLHGPRRHGREGATDRTAAVSIIGELRNSLDLKAGGQMAANLGELYDYMGRRLLKATAENRVEMVDEVMKLLHDIRSAWIAIPSEARSR